MKAYSDYTGDGCIVKKRKVSFIETFVKEVPHMATHTKIIDCRVTKALVDQATKKNSQHCMVAEAVKAAVPDAQHVMVDLATIRFTDTKRAKRLVYLTPKIAQQRLVDFDQGKPLEP